MSSLCGFWVPAVETSPLLVLPFSPSHEICEEGSGLGGGWERRADGGRETGTEEGGGSGGRVGEEVRRIQRGGCGVIIITSRHSANFF